MPRLAGCLAGWLAGWLADWLAGWTDLLSVQTANLLNVQTGNRFRCLTVIVIVIGDLLFPTVRQDLMVDGELQDPNKDPNYKDAIKGDENPVITVGEQRRRRWRSTMRTIMRIIKDETENEKEK